MKTSRQPATTPGIDSGSTTRQNRAAGWAPEHARRLEERQVELLQGGVDRQDHERQEAVDHPRHHRERV